MMAEASFDLRTYPEVTVEQASDLRVSFDRVWPWLKKAVARYGPTHGKRHVWERIESGDAQLWTLEKGAVVTTIEVFPSGLRECHLWLGGGEMGDVRSLVGIVEAWARDEKRCDRMVIVGRKGWGRVLEGYGSRTVTFVKEMT